VLEATGDALGSWLIAKLTTMAVIGVLTALGLWLLGIDLALVLGVIAALLSFIPNFGPIASVIPAALIALATGPDKALYVLLPYAAVQTLESYLLIPIPIHNVSNCISKNNSCHPYTFIPGKFSEAVFPPSTGSACPVT
jgi:predicted PurR-regulated permease PerM